MPVVIFPATVVPTLNFGEMMKTGTANLDLDPFPIVVDIAIEFCFDRYTGVSSWKICEVEIHILSIKRETMSS